MKILTPFLLLLIACAPGNSKTDEVQQDPLDPTVEPPPTFETQEHEYDLSMYNEAYHLKLTTGPNGADKVTSSVLLTKGPDTVISHTFDLDTIADRFYEYYRDQDSLERLDLRNDYELIDLINGSVRTDNLYLSPILRSKIDQTLMPITIKFKYRGKDRGKLYVNVL